MTASASFSHELALQNDSFPGKQKKFRPPSEKKRILHTSEQVLLLNLEFYIRWNSVSQSERSHFFEIEG